MRCHWCHRETDTATEDHAIPRSLGGTLDFSVMACVDCQTKLSRAEEEVSRRSLLAINALVPPIRPRHPERPRSGLLKPHYILVKHPFGGYGESIMRTGERMEALPHIEINVAPEEPPDVRLRGPSAEGVQRILDLI